MKSNKSDPWFGHKSVVIPDPILLSPEPFPLSPDPSHILGFEPWAHIPCYDPVIGVFRIEISQIHLILEL